MAEAVIVCYGGVVNNEAFSGLVLKDGDVLEIARPVGGG
jgi:sulfur carrier protein ThiS|tara:strand:+ start:259 stop:375 length:117 start_codon:yes stop_codon:yes gene_type:complete